MADLGFGVAGLGLGVLGLLGSGFRGLVFRGSGSWVLGFRVQG